MSYKNLHLAKFLELWWLRVKTIKNKIFKVMEDI